MVDVEADGPIPGDYSMISVGAVLVNEALNTTFYAQIKPISEQYVPQALAVSGHTREQTLLFDDPKVAMTNFKNWIETHCKDRPIFISDNNGFETMPRAMPKHYCKWKK